MRKIPQEKMVCADRTAGGADCCERGSYFIFPVWDPTETQSSI